MGRLRPRPPLHAAMCVTGAGDHAWLAARGPALPGRARRSGPARITGRARRSRAAWIIGAVRTNDEVAALLAEYADLLAITGGDAFRIRSYEKAARSVGGYPQDLARVDPAELDKIPNVGGPSPPRSATTWAPATSASWRRCAPGCPTGCAG